MKITTLKANHFENPIGFDLDDLSLSWIVEETAAKRTAIAELWISTSADFSPEKLVYGSGPLTAVDSRSFRPGIQLSACTRYYWQVKVTGDNGDDAVSDKTFFETGKLDQPWQAQWISPDLDCTVHPYLRKAFDLDKAVESARLYVSAVGLYELAVNGEKVSDEYLLPGYFAYDRWMQYQVFDVTSNLQPGANAIGFMLGRGWYSGRFGLVGRENIYGSQLAAICELQILFEDGSQQVISTDEDWKSTRGPVQSSGIYDGEDYDANFEIDGWSQAGLDDQSWSPVSLAQLPIGPLCERLSPPVIKHESFQPVAVIQTPKGETVLDFGQNMAGWVEFDANLAKDEKIIISYGEILQDGCFYRDNLRSARAEFSYVSSGKPAHVRPHFTYFGFRYAKVEGNLQGVDRYVAYAIHSKIDPIGEITTSDSRVNRLVQNAFWGQKSNFVDVPTDCPQRDERLGWTGDTQIFTGTANFFSDSTAFYHKYLRDMREEQLLIDGSIPLIVPRVRGQSEIGTGEGSSVWGDAATVIPWTVYLFSGDRSLLEKHYPMMKDWVDYIIRLDDAQGGKRLWQTGNHIADWLALDNPDQGDLFSGGTDPFYVASAYYYYSTGLLADAAEALGKTEDQVFYRNHQLEIRKAFAEEYFTPNGKISVDTQTAHILALYLGLIPDDQRGRVLETLKAKIIRKGMHLDTGFVGTPYLCRVLSSEGANDFAYKLLMNEDIPGWLYPVTMGATTIWERWDSVDPDGKITSTGMNSLNHYAYGSIVEWIARDVCGLNPVFSAPGFKKACIKPQPYGYLDAASIRYQSASGTYLSSWKFLADGQLQFEFMIPFDCTAEIVIPDAVLENIGISGNPPLDQQQKGSSVVLTVEAGSLGVTYRPSADYTPHLSIDSPLQDILAHEQGRQIFEQYLPDYLEHMQRMPDQLERNLSLPMKADPVFGPAARLTAQDLVAMSAELLSCRIARRSFGTPADERKAFS